MELMLAAGEVCGGHKDSASLGKFLRILVLFPNQSLLVAGLMTNPAAVQIGVQLHLNWDLPKK